MRLRGQMKFLDGSMQLVLYVLIAAVMVLKCSEMGGGTEVPPGYVAGRMYTEDGGVAAKTAVRFVKITQQPLEKTSSEKLESFDEMTVVTNDRGEIIFDNEQLKDGYYTVSGELKTLKSYMDSVLFKDGVCNTIIDTLRRPGSLTGKIKLYYGDDSRQTWVYLPGIKENFCFVHDTSGLFTIDNLAEGTYRVRFDTKYPVYLPLDTVISIRSGHHDTLPNPIQLRYLIQIQKFAAQYDTLMRCVTFTWGYIDSSTINGYNLEIDMGYNRVRYPITGDTTFSKYIDKYICGRLSTLNINNTFMQNYTQWIYINAREIFPVKSIYVPTDSVRTAGWILYKDQFCVLCRSHFNSHEWSYCVYDKSGVLRSTTSLTGLVKQPLDIAEKSDTVYVLERKNEDTLCIHPLFLKDSIECTSNLLIQSNGAMPANFIFAPNGKVYVSQNLSTCILDSSGRQIGRVNNLATNFALSATGFYTFMNGINSPGKPKKIAHFRLEDDTMVLIDTPVYDTYGSYAEIPRVFAANNKGIICCCAGQSIFVNYRFQNRDFNARLYLGDQLMATDLLLTEANELFILYENGQIDVADLSERIDMFEQK
jgi:hypothetical protein